MELKLTILAGIGLVALALVALPLYIMGAGTIEPFMGLEIALVLGLVAASAYIVAKNAKSLSKGLPTSDELAKKVHWKAAAYAYFFTVWLAVGLLWYNTFFVDEFGFVALSFGQVIAAIVLVPGMVFLGLWLLFGRRGDV